MWAEHHQGAATCGEEPGAAAQGSWHREGMGASLTSLGKHLGEEGEGKSQDLYVLQGCSPAGVSEEDNLSAPSSCEIFHLKVPKEWQRASQGKTPAPHSPQTVLGQSLGTLQP